MKNQGKTLVRVAVLVALEIVLARFLSISTEHVRIGFGFVPLAVIAMLYGPLWAAAGAALADFLGAILFPIGPYFPGFTLTAALTGLVFGLFLYRRSRANKGWLSVVAAVVLNNLVISLFLNTFWISLVYGSPFAALLPLRIFQAVVMSVVQTVALLLLRRPVRTLTSTSET